jgi:hypothetical protein
MNLKKAKKKGISPQLSVDLKKSIESYGEHLRFEIA